MNYQLGHQAPEEAESLSFDFWKTNYSGRLEKSFHLQESPLQHDIFEGMNRIEEDLWRVDGFDKAANRRLQNKMNSKRAREKKKSQMEEMQLRIRNLETENLSLRQLKSCRWCQRSLSHFAHSVEIQKPQDRLADSPKQIYFEQLKQPRGREWRSKIWLAIGILMLVVGLQMHGLTGSDEKSVKICEKQAFEWSNNLEMGSKEPLKIRMKVKAGPAQMKGEKWKEKWKGDNWEGNGAKQKGSWLNAISFESQEEFAANFEEQELAEINIDKDLLFSIQAEFDDIGRYI